MNKRAAVLLIAVLALSALVMAESAFAQSIPKPSVPTFTLKLIDNSYDVPSKPATAPTYTIDPYSGKQTILNPGEPSEPGYHVENKTIELWIKKQQYSYYNGSATFNVFFSVRRKGHFGENWTELYPIAHLRTVRFNINFNGAPAPYLISNPIQSNSDYTILSFYGDYDIGDQVDFQVKAMIGHESQYYAGTNYGNFIFNDYYVHAIAFDTESDWSPTQTFTMPNTSTSTPLNLTVIGIIAVAIILVAIVSFLLFCRRQRKTSQLE